MVLAEKDKEILRLLFSYRYLQSSQLSRLTSRSSQVIRRAIRKRLQPDGYVVNMAERTLTEEAAYALGKEGFRFIAFEQKCPVGELPFSSKIRREKSYFWKHTVLTNNIRIAFDLGSRKHDKVALYRTVAEWEMADPRATKPEEKFLLWERLSPDGSSFLTNGKDLISFRPDALFLIHPQTDRDYQVAYFLESDRGPESVVSKIQEKFIAYKLYHDELLFNQRFEAKQMRCLFVLEAKSDYRIRTMQKLLHQMAEKLEDEAGEKEAQFVKCFRFALFSDISEQSVYNDAIWQDWKGEGRALVKRG